MSEMPALESPLEAVEKDVTELKVLVRRGPQGRPWYETTIGSMRSYPEFAEVVRFGRELRETMDAPENPE
jgi:hypothetical protein